MGDRDANDECAHEDVKCLGGIVSIYPLRFEHVILKLLEDHGCNRQTDVTDHEQERQTGHLVRSASAEGVQQHRCKQNRQKSRLDADINSRNMLRLLPGPVREQVCVVYSCRIACEAFHTALYFN